MLVTVIEKLIATRIVACHPSNRIVLLFLINDLRVFVVDHHLMEHAPVSSLRAFSGRAQ